MGTKATKPQMKKLGRPVGKWDEVDRRAKIIEAAIQCFAEKGYAKASNRDIALCAGLTSGSLYHYFDSKASMYQEALRAANQALVNEYRTACRAAPDASSMEQLALGLDRVVKLAKQRPGLMRFAAASWEEIRRSDELHWFEREETTDFYIFFHELLQRARARGELAHGIDIDVGASVLIACISGLAAMHDELRSEKEFALLLRTFKHLLKGEFMSASSG